MNRERLAEKQQGMGLAEQPHMASRIRLVRVFAPTRRPARSRVPRLLVEIPYEGKVRAVIRGARNDQDAAPLRAWLETDEEMREFCRLARRLRDRLGAA